LHYLSRDNKYNKTRGNVVNKKIAAAMLSACVGFSLANVAQAEEGPIKVGILHSLSGTMAISESTLKDTMLMLIEKQNEKGGLLGRKLEPVVVDPASNWPLFAEKARELLAQDKVDVIFGNWTSVSRKSVLPVVEELNGLLFTVIGAYFLFNETFSGLQWMGVAVLMAGIFGLAIYNMIFLEAERDTLNAALALAVLTGLFVAAYTTFDAYGIRATADPFTFLAWFFMIDGLAFPIIAYRRWHRMENPPAVAPLMRRGVFGGIVAFLSFGSIMLATRLDKVGEAAILRETSTVFAALIGWLVLKETVGPRRVALMALIAVGAVIVEFGG